MEIRRLKKIPIIFISLLLIFSIYSIYLTQQYPHKIRGIFFYLDNGRNELDHLNLSEVQLTLNNTGYSLKYTNNLPYQFSGEGLEITPDDNPDVVIYLIKDNYSDIFFYGWMEYEVRFPGGYGDWGKAEEILSDKMGTILSILGLKSLENDIYIGDDDFVKMFEVLNSFIFFFLLSIILNFAFLYLYKKGVLLDKILEHRLTGSELKGILLMFIGLFPLLFMFNELINAIIINNMKTTVCTTICSVIAIIFIIVGFVSLFQLKRTRQNQC